MNQILNIIQKLKLTIHNHASNSFINVSIIYIFIARSHERGSAPDYGHQRKDYSNATNYAQLVAEKEMERRRKAKETKMRQEFNPYK